MSEDEDIILWQDILDSIAGGRPADLQCPFCKQGTIIVEQLPRTTRVRCPTCRKFIEGQFPQE